MSGEPMNRDTVTIGTFFADQLSRIRALTPLESDLLAILSERTLARQPLRRWRAAEDTRLRQALGRGLTAPEAAQELGRSITAVRSRIRQLKRKGQTHGQW